MVGLRYSWYSINDQWNVREDKGWNILAIWWTFYLILECFEFYCLINWASLRNGTITNKRWYDGIIWEIIKWEKRVQYICNWIKVKITSSWGLRQEFSIYWYILRIWSVKWDNWRIRKIMGRYTLRRSWSSNFQIRTKLFRHNALN
jgi:hypothetical protein